MSTLFFSCLYCLVNDDISIYIPNFSTLISQGFLKNVTLLVIASDTEAIPGMGVLIIRHLSTKNGFIQYELLQTAWQSPPFFYSQDSILCTWSVVSGESFSQEDDSPQRHGEHRGFLKKSSFSVSSESLWLNITAQSDKITTLNFYPLVRSY